ncbi:MAG TPA: hypothetical protein VM871_04410, partial [Flavisolibacter sp.]|nr:hypothetical protein [Flavisolibacter sp.]
SKERFKDIEPFSREHLDVFVVKKQINYTDSAYLLNANGQFIAGPFTHISTPYSADPQQDWADVVKSGKRGLIDYKGTVIAPAVYDKIEDNYKGSFELWKEGKIDGWLSQKTGKITAKLPLKEE